LERIGHVLMPPPFLLSAFHLNTAVALGVAAAEMLAFGREYARNVVRNSQALAQGLIDHGVPVFTAASGCTRSHQVILENGGFVSPEGVRIKEAMERCGILADAVVRIGTQDVTRRGMGEAEMRAIAGWIADAAQSRRAESAIAADVTALAGAFHRLRYCFDIE
jgi:glycine hydroxymethyltransferase